MTRLTLSLLGGFDVSVDGTPVHGFDTDKTRALLAYLAVEAARPHGREALAGLLWPELPEDAARRNLRNSLFKLRQALGAEDGAPGFLLVTPKTVQLDPAGEVAVDVVDFTRLLAVCRAHRHRHVAHCATCHSRLEQAAALYGGDLLTGFHLGDCAAFEEWLVLTRERLHREALQALIRLATYHEGRAEDGPALEYTFRQLELEPWREEAHRQAMRLLARSGQRSAALAQYEICRKVLAAELHAEPGAETMALHERLTGQAPDDRGPAPQAPVLPPHLPRPLTPFLGREDELRLLIERLDSPDYRLLTLVGPGGVGKTRLALQAATAQVGAFPDGVYWAALAAISSPDLLPASIAQAVGFQFEPVADPVAQLIHYLRDKELLLVLDNFEQLQRSGAATDLLLSILQQAARINLLITSRERLGLQAEFLLDLPGLPLPPLPLAPAGAAQRGHELPDAATLLASSAVRLFVERAQQAHPAFTLSGDTAVGVVDICRLVAGLPLGIVLAAAGVRHWTPAHIAASIRVNLDFLTSTARDAAPQHSSLRAVFNHSWDLLAAGERETLRRLAVFRGGWDAAAATAVAGAAVHDLLSLVDKSLLRQDMSRRFGIHEVLRQYAAEKLDGAPQEHAAVQRRHAEYYLELAELAEEGLRGGEQARWLAQLESEHDNLRGALQWARDTHELAIGLRLGGALWRFWYVRGYFNEGRAQLAAVLAMAATIGVHGGPPADGPPPTAGGLTQQPLQPPLAAILAAKAKVLNGAGALALNQGAIHASRTFYEQSLALRRALEDTRGVAVALNNLGLLAHEQGDYTTARTLHEESLALRRELQDQRGLASSLNNLGIVAYQQGDYEAAHALYQESLALRRELSDKQGIALLLSNLGIVAQSRGDYDAARARHEESLALMRELGNQQGIATALMSLGIVAQNQEHYDAARSRHEESLALSKEAGDKSRVALALYNLGIVAQAQADYATAWAWHHESLTLRRELGDKGGIAASLHNLGLLAQAQADYATAQVLHHESLALRWELGETRGVAACLAGLGGVAVRGATRAGTESPLGEHDQAGPWAWAAQLFAVVAGLLEHMGSVLDIEDRQPYAHNVAVVRGLLGNEAFAHAWAAGRALHLEQVIRAALDQQRHAQNPVEPALGARQHADASESG